MNFILRVLFFLGVNSLIPGIYVSDLESAIIASIVYGIVKLFLKPILKILSLPLNILTLGLFNLIVNGAVLYYSSVIYSGIKIGSFWDAVLAAIVLQILEIIFIERR